MRRKIGKVVVFYTDSKPGQPISQEWHGKGILRVENTSLMVDTGRVSEKTGKPIERKDPYSFVDITMKIMED